MPLLRSANRMEVILFADMQGRMEGVPEGRMRPEGRVMDNIIFKMWKSSRSESESLDSVDS